jgi:hypothetical protein
VALTGVNASKVRGGAPCVRCEVSLESNDVRRELQIRDKVGGSRRWWTRGLSAYAYSESPHRVVSSKPI